MAADFPTTVVAFGQNALHKTNNLGISTLSAAITGSPATFAVTDATKTTTWPTANFVVRIENELIFVSTRSSNTCTVGARAYGGTTSADHAKDITVMVIASSDFYQKIADEVVAIETFLGAPAASIDFEGRSLTDAKRLEVITGTITTDIKLIDASVTWNAGGVTFTAMKIAVTDTASAAGSLLLDLLVGGASKLKVNKAGDITIAGALDHDGTTVGFYAKAPAAQAAASANLTDNIAGTTSDTLAAIPDPADAPASADALRDDLVTNVIPKIRDALSSIRLKVNKTLTTERDVGLMAT